MKTEFVKWGNSLALRIPSAFAREPGAFAGRKAEMTIERDVLVVKVALRRRRRRYRLKQLIEGIDEQNRHGEIDWGPRQGNEAW